MFSAHIKKDHQAILAKYGQVWEHGAMKADMTPDQTKTLVIELVKMIMVHSGAETAVLYPILDQIPQHGREAALKAVSEHVEVEFLLFQLEKLDPSSQHFWGTLNKVVKAFKEHSHEEETVLLPQVDQFLKSKGGDFMEQKIAEYEYSKQHAGTVPHPPINAEGQGKTVAAAVLKTAEESARMSKAETAHHLKHAHGAPIPAQEKDVVTEHKK